jgi:hypothetical protein
MPNAATTRHVMPAFSTWQWGWLLLAVLSLLPAAYFAYQDTLEAGRVMRMQLIVQYSLWETAPDYAGTPRDWTRFAARLLDIDQLMERVRVKHGPLAEQIELDFRRDLALVCGRIIAGYLLLWLAPLAFLYGAGRIYQHRKRS